MKHSDALAKSVLGLFIAITILFVFPEDLEVTSFAKNYSSISYTRNSSQQHVNTSFSPSRFDVNFRLHNTTGMISLVGYVNVNKLTAHKFKPFVYSGSTASFLTKDYASYKAAKNASETLRPATKVFQIHPPSSNDLIRNKSQFTHYPISETKSSSLTVHFKGLEQNCCVPPDVQLAAG